MDCQHQRLAENQEGGRIAENGQKLINISCHGELQPFGGSNPD